MSVAKFATRQKVVAVLLVIVGIILVWQMYALFTEHRADAPMPAASIPPPAAANKPPVTVTPAATAAQFAQATAPAAAAPADTGAAVNPNSSQAEYLRLVNEYQMAQLQRMIAEDNEAIAIARQNAAKAMSETSKLMGGNAFTAPMDNAQANNNEYQLVYTGQQPDGGWTATLKKNGQTDDVLVGSQLNDGAKIISIDDNGVLLQKGEMRKLVTFSGVTVMNSPSTTHQPALAPSVKKNHEVAVLPVVTATHAAAPAKPAVHALNAAQHTHPSTLRTAEAMLEKTGAAAKHEAEKVLAALTPKPESVTVPDKNIASRQREQLDDSAKNSAPDKAVHAKPMPPEAAKPVVAQQAPAVKADDATITLTSEKKKDLLPLQQPMLAFSHARVAADANKPAQTRAASGAPSVNPPNADGTAQAILTKNPDAYTLQLTSDRDLKNVQKFIARNHLQDKAAYFRTFDMQNNPLYILTYGEFTSAAEAKTALEKLSADAKKEGAFIVKFSTIQTVLQKPAPVIIKN